MDIVLFLVMLVTSRTPEPSATDGQMLRLGRLVTGAVATCYIHKGMTDKEVMKVLGRPGAVMCGTRSMDWWFFEYGVSVSYSCTCTATGGCEARVTTVDFRPSLATIPR
jgi:hypothetical protein